MKGRGSKRSCRGTHQHGKVLKTFQYSALLQPKESELHCTELAAHSVKHMNLLMALEVLSVNMIHLIPRCAGFWWQRHIVKRGLIIGTAAESITLIRLITQAHCLTQHILWNRRPADVYQLRVLFCIPTGCPSYWIGMFVPKRWAALESMFPPDWLNNTWTLSWKIEIWWTWLKGGCMTRWDWSHFMIHIWFSVSWVFM